MKKIRITTQIQFLTMKMFNIHLGFFSLRFSLRTLMERTGIVSSIGLALSCLKAEFSLNTKLPFHDHFVMFRILYDCVCVCVLVSDKSTTRRMFFDSRIVYRGFDTYCLSLFYKVVLTFSKSVIDS